MSPITTNSLPEGPEWSFQLKWDGYRLIASIEDGKVRLYSKKMLPQNAKYPEIAAACAMLKGSLLLDGEAVVLDPDTGRPSFQKLQQRNKPDSSGILSKLPVQFIVFDLLREPIGARVIGSERTEEGVLRHPKLLMLEI